MDNAQFPNLFLDKESSDVQLHVHACAEDSEFVVPAHRLVLSTACKIFKTMLENANEEGDEDTKVKVIVKGDTHDAIRFLRYLYTRELEDVELKVYISLLRTSHLYELDGLSLLCNERIAGKLTPLTVCKVYRSLKNFASESLLTYCIDLMLDCAFLIFWKNLHLTLDEKTMVFLFESKRLNYLDQEQALSALNRWVRWHGALANLKDKGEHAANLLAQLEKSLDDNATPWFFENLALPSTVSVLWNRYVLPSETSVLWKYWKYSDKEKSEEKLPSVKYIIKTQPRLKNNIMEIAKVCYLSQNEIDPKEINITGESTRLMNIYVNRDVLLAGFTIQIKKNIGSFEGVHEIHEIVVFLLNDRELLVNNYEVAYVSDLNRASGVFIVSNLKISLRTPVLLQKSKVNMLAMVFQRGPLFSSCLTAYTFPVSDYMLQRDNIGPFSKGENQEIAVSHLYYFV